MAPQLRTAHTKRSPIKQQTEKTQNMQLCYGKTTRQGKKCYTVKKKYHKKLLPCLKMVEGKMSGKVFVENGKITVFPDYMWNGLDWFPDLRCALEASLVHDALTGLIKNGRISSGSPRNLRLCVDQQFYCMVRAGCSSRFIASVMYNAVRGNQNAGLPGGLVGGFLGAITGTFFDAKFSCRCRRVRKRSNR